MGLSTVIEQTAAQQGLDPTGVNDVRSTASRQPAELSAEVDRTGPSIALVMNGQRVVLDTMTLILYGVALADLLLLYIALRV